MEQTVYLSLGSNLGNREAHLRAAIQRLAELGEVIAVSSLYETQPVEFTAQPWFLNCAVALCTNLKPETLLSRALEIERELGRQRTLPKGPRIIDIDILLFGDLILATPDLNVPHPAMQRRRFVLEPLAEIAPDAQHPVLHQSVRAMLQALPPNGGEVRKLAPTDRKPH